MECSILVLGSFYQLLDILCSFYVYLRLKPLPKKREDNECMNKDSIEAYNKVSKVANAFLFLKITFALLTSILFIVYVVSYLKIIE